ncbi:MAG: hypothetical protein ABIO70_09700 [Pseudomonadota bacterium]
MPREPMDLDILLDGGGEDTDWLALVRDPDAEAAWQDALRRRRTVDEVAALSLGRPWLARRLLALGRMLRRSQAALSTAPALVLKPSVLTMALEPGSLQAKLEVSWGQRLVRCARLGEVIYISAPEGGQVWYSTAAGEGLLTSVGWEVQEGDLPLLLVVVEGRASSFTEALAQAPTAAVCVVVPEGENGPV